jgi:7-carboxy-7-deazaguanine synthase
MLLINEIYSAVCGESRFIGRPCVLVRLTGCHLRCLWCDSEHSFSGGERLSIDAIMERIALAGLPTVLVTGGEPLLQKPVVELMARLLDDGRTVLLETSGTRAPDSAVPLTAVPEGVHRVVDVKAPGSGIDAGQIDWAGLAALGERDEIKVVLKDRADYEWARELVKNDQRIPRGVRIGFSPVFGHLEGAHLAEWILEDRLDVVVQVQLHRVLWPDQDRGV